MIMLRCSGVTRFIFRIGTPRRFRCSVTTDEMVSSALATTPFGNEDRKSASTDVLSLIEGFTTRPRTLIRHLLMYERLQANLSAIS